MGRHFDDAPHPVGVSVFVALGPEGLDRRPFFGVEGAAFTAVSVCSGVWARSSILFT
jgi:hypothetical protein